MLGFAIVYVVGYYLLSLYFGYTKASVEFSYWSIIHYIIPLTVIIITTEMIRNVLLAQKNKFTKVIVEVITVVIDLLIYASVYDIGTLDGFLSIMGYVLFASISCNLLYNYVVIRFGIQPIIVYRFISVMYVYLIPYVPNVYIFLRSFLRMLYPYVIYLVLEYSYAKRNHVVAYRDKKRQAVEISVLVVITSVIIMLVSCEGKYGVLVIGSSSMRGSIDKGDVVLFEKYEEEQILKGDVIIFQKEDLEIVHRVVDIKVVNGENRYYTKGDANQSADEGYIREEDIVGMVKLKIKYIGYPTLIVREIFS